MKSMQKFVAALLGTALCAVLLATAAFAQGGVAVTLPVSIRTAGADPEPNAAYTHCLQAVDNAPMPDGAQNGQYSVTVQGAGDYTFPQITYTAPGIYYYQISHAAGADTRCTYDATVYNVTVAITNKQDGTGLESAVTAHTGPSADKRDAMLFTNVYAPRPTTPPTATPTPKPETPVVHPTPEPTPVTRVLIQTGQLNWPIPVLGGLAVVLVVVGVALTRKKAKKHDAE
ncbi:MAG: FctA domain-containing protein [Eubacteriales bacterium]|nr:FctA domain-containing protein [Eubacteriales bacterium]